MSWATVRPCLNKHDQKVHSDEEILKPKDKIIALEDKKAILNTYATATLSV